MSYQKSQLQPQDLAATVLAAVKQDAVTPESLADELTAAGAMVQLDTGETVWVSSIVHDKPDTPQIDFLTAAVVFNSDGTVRTKGNGQLVAHAFWSGVWPDALASLGIDTVRKALMMVALGEPQPQVPIPNPDPLPAPQQQNAVPLATADSHSIRSQITAANQLGAPLADAGTLL